MKEAHDAQNLRSAFLHVLRSTRSSEVALSVKLAKPVANPLFQEASPPRYSEAMNACPKADITNLKDKLQEENLYLINEAGEQGRLPVLILSLKENNAEKRPAIVILHSTNKNKEWLRPLLEAYASRGYVAVAIDSRYHGERASSLTTYRDALISSWKKGDTMPFIFDTTRDLIKLADYLTTQREDIDPTKIGITGESLGGMHAWFAAFADTRYAVVVPIIGVQGFGWAIDNNMWQARVDSIKPVFEEARIDLGKSEIDKQVVEKVWDRIAPGLASQFDSPSSIPAIAPRPLLIVNGAKDPRCPVGGLEIPKSRACKAYEDEHSIGNFKVIEQPEIGHQMTSLMVIEASHWCDRFLMGSNTKDDILPGAKQSEKAKLSTSPSRSESVSDSGDTEVTPMEGAPDALKLRSQLLNVLRSRRSGEVPLSVEPAKPVTNPLLQEDSPPNSSEIEVMNSCPKANIHNLKDKLKEENMCLITEAGEQGRLPVLILSMKESNTQKRPAIVFLHRTNMNKEWLRPLLEAYASRGYVTIAIDSRYHGERASSISTYQDALISSWKKGNTMPFVFDTVWDLIKLADYLTQREDVDPSRIGISGESLGGMHAWFAAAADTRYTVVVPIIGVQGFRWAIDNDKWQARINSIKPVFEEARIDLGKSEIDKEVVEKVWDRIAPGLASQFDSPYSIPAIAPRPLLILAGVEDRRCPIAGLEIPKSRAIKAYEDANSIDNFKLIAQPRIWHRMTPVMVKEASDWFDRFLRP